MPPLPTLARAPIKNPFPACFPPSALPLRSSRSSQSPMRKPTLLAAHSFSPARSPALAWCQSGSNATKLFVLLSNVRPRSMRQPNSRLHLLQDPLLPILQLPDSMLRRILRVYPELQRVLLRRTRSAVATSGRLCAHPAPVRSPKLFLPTRSSLLPRFSSCPPPESAVGRGFPTCLDATQPGRRGQGI